MQLTYRGCAYALNSQASNTIHRGTLAQYRGATYNIPQPVKTVTESVVPLKYRGVTYFGHSEEAGAIGCGFSLRPAM